MKGSELLIFYILEQVMFWFLILVFNFRLKDKGGSKDV